MLDRRDTVETVQVVSVDVERWKAWGALWPLPPGVASELPVHAAWNCILLGAIWASIAERARLHVRLMERPRIVFPFLAWRLIASPLRSAGLASPMTVDSVLRILRDGPDGPIAQRELALFALQGKTG